MSPIASWNIRACAKPFWPVGASSTISDSWGAPGSWRCDDALELGQLVHEVALRVQPAGGVDDQDVGAARRRRLDRVEHHRGGIGAGRLADDLDADPLPPRLQLLDGRGPERVGRGQERRGGPSPLSAAASLAHVVVLPEPLTPSIRITLGRASRASGCGRSERVEEEAAEERAQLIGAGHRAEHHFLAAAVDEVGGERGPEVGGDQQLLQLLPQRVVDGPIGLEDRRRDRRRETPASAGGRRRSRSPRPEKKLIVRLVYPPRSGRWERQAGRRAVSEFGRQHQAGNHRTPRPERRQRATVELERRPRRRCRP